MKNQNKRDYSKYSFKRYIEEAKKVEDIKQIFGNFIFHPEICFMAGESGAGKSVLSYQIADAVSRGKSLFDERFSLGNEVEPLKVLQYDFELSKHQIKKRFYNYNASENHLRPDIEEIMQMNDFNFDFSLITEDVEATGCKLLIIDNMDALAVNDTKEGTEALRIMRELIRLKSKGISIIIVIHLTKRHERKPLIKSDIYGASKLVNLADSIFFIDKSDKDKQIRYLKQAKTRNAIEYDDVFTLKLTGGDYLHFEPLGWENEKEHVIQQNNVQTQKYSRERIEKVNEVFSDGELSYTDAVYRYSNLYNVSEEAGKKFMNQVKNDDLIIKDSITGKYIINQNQ